MSNMLKPYEEYKGVHAIWLEKIPSHWECEKLGMNFIERRTKVSDKDYPPLSVTKKGVVPQLETAAKSNDGDNRKLVLSGDFVINSRSDRKGSSGLSKLDGSVSLINIVLEPRTITSNYSHYLLKSHGFIEEYYRNGRGIVADLWTTRYWEMRNILIPIPPITEQEQIVKYLDSQLAKIDRFIESKKMLLVALQEQIECYLFGKEGETGDIKINSWDFAFPKEWLILKAKRVFKEIKIKNSPESELLAVTQDSGVVFKKDCEQNFVSPSGDLSGLKLVRKGDFVISLRSFQGGIEYSDIEGIVSPAYNVFNLRDEYSSEEYKQFYKYLFKTRVFISVLNTLVSGIRDGKNINYSDFAEITIPVPGQNTTAKIVKLIRKYESLKKQFEKEFVLLTEYRNRLISDVVTGEVDIRGIIVDEILSDSREVLDIDKVVDSEEAEV